MATRLAYAIAIAIALGTVAPRAHGAPEAAAPRDSVTRGAHDSDAADFVPAPPPAFEGLGLDERTGAKIPLDVAFRDQDGKDVVLADYFKDDLPVILTFNYSDCPMLCSLQLGALTQTLPALTLEPGAQFKIVTIDLEPRETPARAKETRQKYIDRMPPDRRAGATRGWTFLVARSQEAATANPVSIRRVADAVGFHYKYVPERNEYAHPAALIFVTARGMVSRYIGGTDYPPDVVRTSIELAGLSETATSTGFINNCFHYEPGGHPHAAVVAMRIGAFAFLVLFISALGVWRMLRRRRSHNHGVVRS